MNATSVAELKEIIGSLKLDATAEQSPRDSRERRNNGMTPELRETIKDVRGFKDFLAKNNIVAR